MATLSRMHELGSFGRMVAPPAAIRATSATAAASFADLLAVADAARTGAPTPAVPAPPASSFAPLSAATANGRLPATALVPIGSGGHRLAPPAAAAFHALTAAAARDGVHLEVNSSYRSFEQQVELAQRKGLYSQGGLAARPGTSSHGLGLSVDLDLDGRAQAWMRANGRRFGFVEDVPREPWHWTYKPA